jgi:enolase
VGDDLLATNKERLEKAIKMNACTTILIKPNQIGTISETLEVINLARKNNINYIVSHRSGETNDSFIADFAVGIQADFVKFGAPCRGERVAKYNRLWQIEREELK